MTHKGKLALIEFEEIVEGGWSPEPTVSEFRDILAYVDELERENDEVVTAAAKGLLADNAARNNALEEAAKVADQFMNEYWIPIVGGRTEDEMQRDDEKMELSGTIAETIRNLKST